MTEKIERIELACSQPIIMNYFSQSHDHNYDHNYDQVIKIIENFNITTYASFMFHLRQFPFNPCVSLCKAGYKMKRLALLFI